MNDLMLLFTILSSVIVGVFLGSLITFLCFRYAFSQKENEIDTSDPKLKDEEVDCQIMVNVYKSGKVNMTPYTKNQEPLPVCVREEALHKAMLQLGYTKPLKAVCTKSTTLEPVAVEVDPEPVEHALDVVCEPPAGELKHLDKIKAGIQQNGGKNAQASEFKAN